MEGAARNQEREDDDDECCLWLVQKHKTNTYKMCMISNVTHGTSFCMFGLFITLRCDHPSGDVLVSWASGWGA
jgi:hypothetical protein